MYCPSLSLRIAMSTKRPKQQVVRSSNAYPSATYAMVSSELDKPAGGQVHYEIETSSGGRGVVVYEVHEVYVYIPPELSAAGFELKIGGVIRITDRVCACVCVCVWRVGACM